MVITGVGLPGSPARLITGSLTAPYALGTYTLTPSNLFANVIRLGQTGVPAESAVTARRLTLLGVGLLMPAAALLVQVATENRTGLRIMLNAQPGIEAVGEAADGQQAVRLARELRPDVCLFDIRMPVLDGLQATRLIAGPGVADPLAVVVTLRRRRKKRPVASVDKPSAPTTTSGHAASVTWPVATGASTSTSRSAGSTAPAAAA